MTLQEISSYIKGKEFKDFVVYSLLNVKYPYIVSRAYYGRTHSETMQNEILQKYSFFSLNTLKYFAIVKDVRGITNDLYSFEVFFNFEKNDVEIRYYDKYGSDPDPYIALCIPFEIFETFDVKKMFSYLEDHYKERAKKAVKYYIQRCRESRKKKKKKEEEVLYDQYVRLKDYFEKKENKNA